MTKKDWYASWFDTPYYHLLYRNRDEAEAERFLDNLLEALQLNAKSRILDLACGKGRHSIYLAGKGYEVTGVDLSPQSIRHARRFERPNLSFFVHDMRKPFRNAYFDYVFNLFTSFGYFGSDQEHLDTLLSITRNLQKDGILVLDYLNAFKVIEGLKRRQQKTVGGIRFRISRKVDSGYIVKKIRFSDKGTNFQFEERVRAFTLADFKTLFAEAGLELVRTYGDYNLSAFRKNSSDRLILVGRPV